MKLSPTLLFSVMAMAVPGATWAQSTAGAAGLLNDQWVVNLGAFVFGTEVKARLDGQSLSNPEIDFDKTFGKANDATRVRGDLLWRITPEHRLRAMYFNNSVARSRVLEEDVRWGDYTFNSGSRAEFRHKLQVLDLSYEYAFLRRPTYEVAASAGVHYMDMTLQLSGTASITDAEGNTTTSSATTKSSSLPAPLPVLGLRVGWVAAPDWYIVAEGQFFKSKIGSYDGYWSDMRVGATWMYHRNYGIGLGYDRFLTNLDVSKDDFDGRLKLGYSGLQAYLTGTF
jgi:hypothetical protein